MATACSRSLYRRKERWTLSLCCCCCWYSARKGGPLERGRRRDELAHTAHERRIPGIEQMRAQLALYTRFRERKMKVASIIGWIQSPPFLRYTYRYRTRPSRFHTLALGTYAVVYFRRRPELTKLWIPRNRISPGAFFLIHSDEFSCKLRRAATAIRC